AVLRQAVADRVELQAVGRIAVQYGDILDHDVFGMDEVDRVGRTGVLGAVVVPSSTRKLNVPVALVPAEQIASLEVADQGSAGPADRGTVGPHHGVGSDGEPGGDTEGLRGEVDRPSPCCGTVVEGLLDGGSVVGDPVPHRPVGHDVIEFFQGQSVLSRLSWGSLFSLGSLWALGADQTGGVSPGPVLGSVDLPGAGIDIEVSVRPLCGGSNAARQHAASVDTIGAVLSIGTSLSWRSLFSLGADQAGSASPGGLLWSIDLPRRGIDVEVSIPTYRRIRSSLTRQHRVPVLAVRELRQIGCGHSA